uniref:Uncharacterized protein n=1 Tax=Labrus bergylta TaxID=56723 RepID=A0A3Q3GKT9_9LABR
MVTHLDLEPLDGALVVVAADHLAVRHLLTEAVCGLVGVDGEVDGRGVPLLFALTLLLLQPLADGWLESRLSLFRWRRGRRAEVRSGAGESWTLERRSAGRRSASLGSCSDRDSVIWVTTWIFSSPSSWLVMSALCSRTCRRFLCAASCSPLYFSNTSSTSCSTSDKRQDADSFTHQLNFQSIHQNISEMIHQQRSSSI